MNHVDVIIPTRHRYEKLKKCLASIPKKANGIDIWVIVICDGDHETALKISVDGLCITQKQMGSVYCRNLYTSSAEDAVIYAVDDMEFKPNSIAMAIKAMKKYFPDEDGVVGFNQINGKKPSPAGVALVGQKFLQRYPDKKLFYPGYFHFSCQEIKRLADKYNKFHFEEKAQIIHHHPGLEKNGADQTHIEARKYRERDRNLSMMRKQRGEIWGDS